MYESKLYIFQIEVRNYDIKSYSKLQFITIHENAGVKLLMFFAIKVSMKLAQSVWNNVFLQISFP